MPRAELDTYAGVNETCARFGVSRAHFYRLLADPALTPSLESIVLRVPPSGRLRVPQRAFEGWLRAVSRPR